MDRESDGEGGGATSSETCVSGGIRGVRGMCERTAGDLSLIKYARRV